MIALPGTAGDGAERVAETLRTKVEGLGIGITISLGVASCRPDLNLSPSSLTEAADRALYQAKQDGRNCVRLVQVSDSAVSAGYITPSN